jgi:microcystin-dependent protein
MSQPFVGEIKLFGFNFNPRGYSLCNGQTIAITQQQALFALIGTYYGGNGTSTFQLPNLQSRVPIGFGQGAGLSLFTLGEAGGVENVSILLNNMPQHNHTAQTTVNPSSSLAATTVINALTGVTPTSRLSTPAGNLLTVAALASGGPNSAVDAYAAPGTGTAATMATGPTGAATTTLTGGVTATAQTTVGVAGGNVPVSIQQPYLAINYSIAMIGIFPTRS